MSSTAAQCARRRDEEPLEMPFQWGKCNAVLSYIITFLAGWCPFYFFNPCPLDGLSSQRREMIMKTYTHQLKHHRSLNDWLSRVIFHRPDSSATFSQNCVHYSPGCFINKKSQLSMQIAAITVIWCDLTWANLNKLLFCSFGQYVMLNMLHFFVH